jgi:hypothetical protein
VKQSLDRTLNLVLLYHIIFAHKDALEKVAADKAAEEANQLEARAGVEPVIASRQASYSALGKHAHRDHTEGKGCGHSGD